ncbi:MULTISPECIES: hypothetical protein [Vibrio]|jgi:DNA-directed RNA polymerase delta subunit|uniref:hypothetical protein n=1 Tax=Vibrio TaxID=662 RepID=UPI000D3859E3|nr:MULTISPECIES: hypothetical protein [Vibrio]PTP90098.1 hypothetical protein CWO03_05035 [Vibrio splendidus]
MKYLNQALELSKAPVTLEDFLEWDRLLDVAKGEEANRIGELYTTMMSNSTPEIHEHYVMQSIGEA